MGLAADQPALVTKTMISSSALAVSPEGPLTLPAFFDLCSLIDACVILDELLVLKSPDRLPDTELVCALTDTGVVKEFEPQLTPADLRRLMLRLPEGLNDGLSGDEQPLSESDERPPASVDRSGGTRGIDLQADPATLLGQLDDIIDYPSVDNDLRDVERRFRRSQAYIAVAAAHGIDYFPDYDRAPFAAAALRKLYRSLPVQLYAKVAESLGQRLDQEEDFVAEWTTRATLPIPPAGAIVLHRAGTVREIPERILEVRAEFAGYRRHFGSFKAKLQNADTIGERRKLLATYQRLLAETSGPRSEIVSVTEVLNLAQSGVKAGSAPLLPTSYSAALLLQPAEWIRRWWLRRPMAVLFRLDGKLPRISEYEHLIAKLWGDGTNDRILGELARHPRDFERAMRWF